ncbi:hypothetical protein INR49_030998 [Caranx melampygus]|nr:hypothetical protein INR49_030998 [Caranx melampygus]
MADLLKLLLRVAEKAANVARVCRQEAPLFQLLVQEKTGDDKNKKFVQDFKTLADVVIQEMIRHDVGAQFPEMLGFIHGEESNKFENGLVWSEGNVTAWIIIFWLLLWILFDSDHRVFGVSLGESTQHIAVVLSLTV